MVTKRKTFQGQVFARSSEGFRGVRTGMGAHYDRQGWIRSQVNFVSDHLGLATRQGMRRAYKVDATGVNTVYVMDNERLVFAGGWLDVSGISSEQDKYLTQAQGDARYVRLGASYTNVYSGTFAIPSGQDYVTVTGQTAAFTPTEVMMAIIKPSGGGNLSATLRTGTLTSAGFTADLTGETDNANYSISFSMFG